MAAWSLLSVGEDRHYQGNTGYADVLESHYEFDSTVTYADRVAVGDLVVLKDREVALGVARVERVEAEPGREKVRLVCPTCRRTSLKKRAVASPAYLCQSCRAEFDAPVNVEVAITRYTAHYGGTWRKLDGKPTVRQLRLIALNRSTQQSISPLDPDDLRELLAGIAVPLPPVVGSGPVGTGSAGPAGTPLPAGRRPALVRVRIGQQAFRQELSRRDGWVCAITGPCPPGALQAAHLRAFHEHEEHNPEEGVLLRADVHQLFDRGLMAVDPSSGLVRVAPELRAYPAYASLEGRRASLTGVDLDAVREHFEAAVARWARG
ncbi:HNH endonuclease signature motif containing protein [Saccharothrix sp. BKS2]|uniref:HNH endonuclease n=1 Tax=Saccharothrix sp. BKS2 TaxID=3064400 RepID=UPI0039EB49D7